MDEFARSFCWSAAGGVSPMKLTSKEGGATVPPLNRRQSFRRFEPVQSTVGPFGLAHFAQRCLPMGLAYLQNKTGFLKGRVNVGKHTSPIEHLGFFQLGSHNKI